MELNVRDMASIAWSFARIVKQDMPLIDSISKQSIMCIAEFGSQGLTNTAWSFATATKRDEILLHAVANEVIKKIMADWAQKAMPLEDLATDLNGLTWALGTAEVLTEQLGNRIHNFMMEIGRAQDWEMQTSPAPNNEVPTAEDHPGDEPHVESDLPDMCVVHKPAGWEVDNQDAGGGPWLSTFLQKYYNVKQVPIVHWEKHQFGMVHRLDIPSSGLILIGKTFEGFYSLKWQLQTGNITRDYVLLVHGWVSLDEKLNEETTCESAEVPAQMKVLAHMRRADEEDKLHSLIVMRFKKGKRTDLRTHFAGAGHPTVADGKYTDRETYLRDREWCARKFMHSYRLDYTDAKGKSQECICPLPADLRVSLEKLLPRGPESAAAVEAWIEGAMPKPFPEYKGLQGTEE